MNKFGRKKRKWPWWPNIFIITVYIKVILRLKNMYAQYNITPFTDHNAPIGILQFVLCFVY